MDGRGQYNPRSVEEVFNDFKARRNGMIKALTNDVEDFFQQCDPGHQKESLESMGLDIFAIDHVECSYVTIKDFGSDVSLTFEESVFGGKREIEVPFLKMCGVCGGTGAKSANCVKSCAECGGRGRVMNSQRTPFGVVSQVSTCINCGGDGKIVTDKCVECGGQGNVRTKRCFEVVIPPGVVDGDTIQLRGEGNSDRNRSSYGDLYLVLHVKEKRGIWREGLNLFSRVSIAYTDAILGTVVKVETIEGSKELRIPSGIQPGQSVRLSKMGVPKANERGRGDHIFVVDVQIPKTVSDRERKLLEELISIRASSEECSTLVDGDMGEDQTRQKKHHSYQKVNKPGSSIWNSVERIFGRGQSREGFASVIMNRPPTLWCGKRNPVSYSWFAVFLFSCIFAQLTKTRYKVMLGNTICRYFTHNNQRNNH